MPGRYHPRTDAPPAPTVKRAPLIRNVYCRRWIVSIPRWHPARLNEWDGRHWAVRARLKRYDRDLVKACILGAGVPQADRKRRVSILITLGPRQRAGDPDAYWKSLLDALVACGALTDDNRQGLTLGPVEFARGHEKGTTIIIEEPTFALEKIEEDK